MLCDQHRSPLFPYTTLFRSALTHRSSRGVRPSVTTMTEISMSGRRSSCHREVATLTLRRDPVGRADAADELRSEEHTSELQSRRDLVCRLLLEKKKYNR